MSDRPAFAASWARTVDLITKGKTSPRRWSLSSSSVSWAWVVRPSKSVGKMPSGRRDGLTTALIFEIVRPAAASLATISTSTEPVRARSPMRPGHLPSGGPRRAGNR